MVDYSFLPQDKSESATTKRGEAGYMGDFHICLRGARTPSWLA
jgi:hypothetical protein